MEASLKYLIREPEVRLEKNPLLLLLHGYGSNEQDLFAFASELPAEYYVISVRAPHDMHYGGYAWYAINFSGTINSFSNLGQARESREIVCKFIDEMLSNYPIDPQKVTLIGFSQGAILSYAIALSYPDKIKNVVAMSGYFNPEIAVEGFEINDFSQLKIFASHGTSDQTVPVIWARKAKPALDALGIDIIYKEYPIGHGVSPQNFFDFKTWLALNK